MSVLLRRLAPLALSLMTVLALGCGGASHSRTASPPRGKAAVVGVILDARGHLIARLRAHRPYESAAADGAGGWFVSRLRSASAFDLVRLASSGRPERGFRARVSKPPPPDGLAPPVFLSTRRGVFVGGNFRQVNQARASGLALLDPHTGGVRSGFRSRLRGSEGVSALAISGRTLVAGSASAFQNGSCVAAVDAHSGHLLAGFRPKINQGPEISCIDALLASASSIYVGGNFTPGEGIAKLRLADGHADPAFAPPPPDDRPCQGCHGVFNALVLASGRLIVGGGFRALGAHRVPNIGALDPDTGSLDPVWRAPRTRFVLGLAAVKQTVAVATERAVALVPAAGGRRLFHHAAHASVVALLASGGRFLVLFSRPTRW